MYQKCPICNGSGKSSSMEVNTPANNCHVCNGKGIISQITGLPPQDGITLTTNATSGYFTIGNVSKKNETINISIVNYCDNYNKKFFTIDDSKYKKNLGSRKVGKVIDI